MMRPTRANKPDGYLLGSYRIATAPEPNSSRLTSFKSTRFDSPANNVGPWPTSLGCITNSYSSINPSSASASGSFTPPTNSPLPDCCLSCSTAAARSPRTSWAFQSTWFKVLDRVTMQLFVGDRGAVITASVQGDVDGIAEGPQYVLLERDNVRPISGRRHGDRVPLILLR